LAGFTDASGGFTINLTDRKKNSKITGKWVQVFFRIEVRQNYHRNVTEFQGGSSSSYYNILTNIAGFFRSNLVTKIQHYGDRIRYTFIIIAHSSASQEIVMEYFYKYPLFSQIYLDYIDWREVKLKVINKENLQPKGLDTIKTIKNKFGKNRVSYN
jgi:hypothetical protein